MKLGFVGNPFNENCACQIYFGSGKVGPVNQVNHTSWVAVVTSTDRPKSVRKRCVIELFVALFVLSLCPFDISVGVGAFVIGLSQISSFFSLDQEFGDCRMGNDQDSLTDEFCSLKISSIFDDI